MNWKNTIKNTFKNRKITPNDEIWLRLEKELDKKDNYVKIKWLSVSAVACVAFLVGIFVFYKTDFLEEKTQQIAEIRSGFSSKIEKKELKTDTFPTQITSEKSIQDTDNQIVTKKEENKIIPEKNYDAYVDEIASNFLWEEVEMEIQLKKSLDSIANELKYNKLHYKKILIAQTETSIEKYIAEKYPTEKIVSEVEKELFKERIEQLVTKILDEYDKIRIALNNN